jgi:hypothetical protein
MSIPALLIEPRAIEDHAPAVSSRCGSAAFAP